jgi:hypothetical protein
MLTARTRGCILFWILCEGMLCRVCRDMESRFHPNYAGGHARNETICRNEKLYCCLLFPSHTQAEGVKGANVQLAGFCTLQSKSRYIRKWSNHIVPVPRETTVVVIFGTFVFGLCSLFIVKIELNTLLFWNNISSIPQVTYSSSSLDATTSSGPGPPHCRGFTITLRHTTLGRTPLDERSTRHRDLYMTTHNTHKRQISMPPAAFEPAIPSNERPPTHALDCAATGIGTLG